MLRAGQLKGFPTQAALFPNDRLAAKRIATVKRYRVIENVQDAQGHLQSMARWIPLGGRR